jgi:hypothetical protein
MDGSGEGKHTTCPGADVAAGGTASVRRRRFQIPDSLAFALLSTLRSELNGAFGSCRVRNQVWKETEIKSKSSTLNDPNSFVYQNN